MVQTLKTIVLLAGMLGAVSAATPRQKARNAKRQACSPTAPPPPATTVAPPPPPATTEAPPPPAPTEAPGGGGGAAGKYNVQDNWIGDAFYNGFDFNTFDDPTHGRVNYVDQATAQSQNLSYSGPGSFVVRADAVNVVDPASRGRNSVRITSKSSYTTHVLVADIKHMPAGGATWPALWEFGPDWPNQGELDIVEGANDATPNLSSLHTSTGCTQPAARDMRGSPGSLDCDAFAPGNVGCGVHTDGPASYGPDFNAAGGGWFAIERTPNYIKMWYWSRGDGAVPAEVRDGASGVNPDNWGQPTGLWTNEQCPLADKFGPNNIVINLTLCGDWAGQTYAGGPAACVDLVNNQPGAFNEAFWDFARLSTYV